jgi:hypothetical protein
MATSVRPSRRGAEVGWPYQPTRLSRGKRGGERYRFWLLLLTLIGVLVGVIGVMAVHGFTWTA